MHTYTACVLKLLCTDAYESNSSVFWRTGKMHVRWLHVGPAEPVVHPHITLTDKEQEIISALEATLSPALHAAAMVSAFVAGQSESNLFGVLEQLARARCSRVSSSTMDTQPRALQAGLGCNSNRGLAYDLYDSLNARADQKTAQLPEGVLSSQTAWSWSQTKLLKRRPCSFDVLF
jgi:hypothetical protein